MAGTPASSRAGGGLTAGQYVAGDGWIDDTATTWTFASATTFTVSGDLTARFQKGTRLKLTQTTPKFFAVVASAHAAGTTTVTVTGGTDYTLASAAITDNWYSYAANPQGYPGVFAFTPTVTASTPPTLGSGSAQTGYFSVVGAICTVQHLISFGTSGAAAGSGVYLLGVPIPIRTGVPNSLGVGSAWLLDAGTSRYVAALRVNTAASGELVMSVVNASDVGAAVPFAWTNNDQMAGMYAYPI